MEESGLKHLVVVDNVVDKIRASLSIATTLLPEIDNVDRCLEIKQVSSVWINSAPSRDPRFASPFSTNTPNTSSTASLPSPSPIQFECGRLKYSHVKREWILRHVPLEILTSTQASSTEKQTSCTAYANRVAVGQSQWTANIFLVRNSLTRKKHSNSRIMGLNEESLGEVKQQKQLISKREFSRISTSSLQHPPIELIQCLLRRAEFISMMEQAKKNITDRNGSKDVNESILCFGRCLQEPVNLYPFLSTVALETGGTISEDNFLKTLDECIMCAHDTSLSFASSSFGEWQVHSSSAALPSLDARHRPSFPGNKERRKKRTKVMDLDDAGASPKSIPPTTAGMGRTVLDFVHRSLGIAPMWDQETNYHLIRTKKKFVESTTCAPHKVEGELPFRERLNRTSTNGLHIDFQMSHPVKSHASNDTFSKPVEIHHPSVSRLASSRVVCASVIDFGGTIPDNNHESPDFQSAPKSPAANVFAVFEGTRNTGIGGENRNVVSILESHGLSIQSDNSHYSAISSRRSPRRKHFRWSDDWKSPLMNLVDPWQKSNSGNNVEHQGNVPLVSSNDNSDGKSDHEEARNGMSRFNRADTGNHEACTPPGNAKVSCLHLKVPSKLRVSQCIKVFDNSEIVPTNSAASQSLESNISGSKKRIEENSNKGSCAIETTGSRISLRRGRNLSPIESSNEKGEVSGGTNTMTSTPKIETKGRKWELWEKMEFLRQLKIHGRGCWTNISSFIPTRTNTQVKTHAQNMMRKLDRGIDIFQGLDEYLENPAAFGKPSDDEARTCVIKGSRTKRNGTKKIGAPIAPTVQRTKWIKLSHMGHISDYHGFGRKYEHFYPLKCGKSLQEVLAEILKTLNDLVDETPEDLNNDFDDEYESYLKASNAITGRAKTERTRRKKGVTVQSATANVEDLPVLFDFSQTSNLDRDKFDGCTIGDCAICELSTGPRQESTHNSDSKFPQFRCFDKDEEDIIHDHFLKEKGDKKRPSRTAQISTQKKASAMLLNELFHTLSFIDKYNNGLFRGETTEHSIAEISGNEDHTYSVVDVSQSCSGKRKSNCKPSFSSKRARVGDPSDERSPTTSLLPQFERLSHAQQMVDYIDLARNSRLFHRITLRSDVYSAIEEIATVLRQACEDLGLLAVNESILMEEKALHRVFRRYNRKADQEKMEKKEFAEKHQIVARNHAFVMAKRRKRENSHEIERKEVEIRALCFVRATEDLPATVRDCPFESACLICSPFFRRELSYEKAVIFNPSFQKIQDHVHYVDEQEANEYRNVDDTQRCNSRKAQRDKMKLSSALKLSELHRTFQFIAKYNEGMINDNK
ncbi:Myb-like DNA-binding protein [Nitzschia inconspicua]|uniref:Myb-like DNA-binding protein n=1 Tax=Nitzschia inconspicua TaxID=303405 RepID=A0A9K3KUJ7_9STRA|nr:Myb-like DNA-binding protein [Nitzschia inconspicua]